MEALNPAVAMLLCYVIVGLAAAAYRNIAPVRSVAACMLSDAVVDDDAAALAILRDLDSR